MNNSQRTKIIAQGIAIYAAFQDQPAFASTDEERKTAQIWEDWQRQYPQFARFVCREHFDLFDRVNAAF